MNSSEKKFILEQDHLPYMGHIFSADGLHADPEKIRAITDMPTPDGPAAVRRFLGMANYLAKFVPALSDFCHPLSEAIKNDEWNWTEDCTVVVKGEVRTINDRNIYERRSCMKDNGKSPTFKFVYGEERRPSEVQRVSRNWRLPGATHSSADLTWIRK